MASQAFSATIFRSVGPGNNSSLSSGGSDLTISGTTATFGNPQPDLVGAGDLIQYDANNDAAPDARAFIIARIDGRQFTVQGDAGGNPSPTTMANPNWSIFRSYTSLSNAKNGIENTGIDTALRDFDPGNRNAVSNHEIWYFACYGDAADTTPVVWDGWTTDATYYIRIYTPFLPTEVGTSQRHLGRWTSGAYALEVSNATALTINDDNVRLEGLQIAVNAVNAQTQKAIDLFNFSGTVDIRISQCLIRGAGNSNQDWHTGISAYNTVNGTIRIWNNIIYNFTGTSSRDSALELKADPVEYYVYNNTVVNCYNGYWRNSNTNHAATVINNIAQNCSLGFDAYFNSASDYNVSDAGSAPGIHSAIGSVLFVGPGDFHLSPSDNLAQNAGTDLSADPNLAFNKDIDSETRLVPWDIGADELAVQPTQTPTVTPTMTPTAMASPTMTLAPSGPTDNPGLNLAYPNPARGKAVTFTCQPEAGEQVTIRVFTARYRKVWQATADGVPGRINRVEWNIGDIPPGIYLYQVEAGTRKSSFKKLAIIK